MFSFQTYFFTNLEIAARNSKRQQNVHERLWNPYRPTFIWPPSSADHHHLAEGGQKSKHSDEVLKNTPISDFFKLCCAQLSYPAATSHSS